MYIFGASGHGKVIASILLGNNVTVDGFIDDNPKQYEIMGIPVISAKNFENIDKEQLIIAIGNNSTRKSVVKRYQSNFFKLIHPSSVICKTVKIGTGSVVFPNTVINANAIIGEHCIINSSAVVEHDCILDDYVHISPNATVAGGVKIGEGSHVGIGACVIPNINIGKWVTIGAGAVVIRDVPAGVTVVGNPARIIHN